MIDLLYSDKIEFLASNHIDEDFYNANDEHAQVVLTSMMRHAFEKVNIMCGNLCTDVSNDEIYLKEIESFLKFRNGSINILLCDYLDEFKERKIYQLLQKYPKQVSIKKIKSQLIINDKPVHFTIADKRAYRLETDIVNKMARGNFNDRDSAIVLDNWFIKLSKEAQDI